MDWTTEQLRDEIRTRVAALGYEVWDVRLKGTERRPVLQVRVDRPEEAGGQGITVDECAAVSRGLEAWLDTSHVLGARYLLEVSSPGMERPLRHPEHWARYVGHRVRLRLAGRGRLTASIQAVLRHPDRVELRLEGPAEESLMVPLEEARDATLVVDWSAVERELSNRKSS